MNIPTPHIRAISGDFAQTVLMPGDPLRSKFIAENYLSDARLVNNVRGVQGYTGSYKGCRVSVMASGMGMPSIGIYSYELFSGYGVENIIRVGSIGALHKDIRIRDIIVAMTASTNSAYADQYGLCGSFAPCADYRLLSTAVSTLEKRDARFHVGNVLSSDTFYNADTAANGKWTDMGVLGIEMETAALYMNAARTGRHALGIFTVSDNIVTGEATDSDQREKSFTQMMETALETAVDL